MQQFIKRLLSRILTALFLSLYLLCLPACVADDYFDEEEEEDEIPFSLSSKQSDGGFDPGGTIPNEFRYSLSTQCNGNNNFPKLEWGNAPPSGTESFVLIVDDPDGGNWVHLNLYNIPKSRIGIHRLPDTSPTDHLTFSSDYGTAGQTDWSSAGWGGPCPPGGTHTYYFKLYAMNENPLNPALSSPTTRSEFESNTDYEDKILGSTEISGTVSP